MYAAPAHLTCSWIDSILQMIKLDAVSASDCSHETSKVRNNDLIQS
jgi:hypothetical protein